MPEYNLVAQALDEHADNARGDDDKLEAVNEKITRAKDVAKKKKKKHDKLKADQQSKRRELEQSKGRSSSPDIHESSSSIEREQSHALELTSSLW